MGIEDRLRRLERRLKATPEPDRAALEATRRLVDVIVCARIEHHEEIEAEATRLELQCGEEPGAARNLALVAVLERQEDGRAALAALCEHVLWFRERRDRLLREGAA